jgi:hypothetical protein
LQRTESLTLSFDPEAEPSDIRIDLRSGFPIQPRFSDRGS